MAQDVKSLLSVSSTKSEQSKCSMHKGTVSASRKRRVKKSPSSDQAKKRRAIRSPLEAQSRPTPPETGGTRLSERQQIALALEESKRTAAAEMIHKRQSSKNALTDDDSEDASESEQDSVSDDESSVKEIRQPAKLQHPASSLVSQHSDVASQLGEHKHQLCARNGRLESLSGGSKHSHSSSKAHLASTSQPESSTPRWQRVESDAESHPAQSHSHMGAADSSKRPPSVERQRTSDVSSRDVIEAVDEIKGLKDESESQDVAAIRQPVLEDGLDLTDLRTQRLALRHLSQSLKTSSTGGLHRQHKLKHLKSEPSQIDGKASSQHLSSLGKGLKVRTKLEDGQRSSPHIVNAESPATLEGFHSSKTKGSIHTPRQLDHRNSDLNYQFPPFSRQQHGNTESTPRSWHARHSAPLVELVESDLFSDLTPRRSGLESRPSAPVISPRLHAHTSSETLPSSSSRPHPFVEASVPAQRPQPQHKTGLKVTLKHRLAVTDGCRPPVLEELAAAAASAVQPPTPAIAVPAVPAVATAPAAEQSKTAGDVAMLDSQQQPALQQPPQHEAEVKLQLPASEADVVPAPTKAHKRKAGRSGRPSAACSFQGAASQDLLRSPLAAAEPSAAQAAPRNSALQTANHLEVPETDAKPQEPSFPAARSRGRLPKGPKRTPTSTTLNGKRMRSLAADDDSVKATLSSVDSRSRHKGSSLLAACKLLAAQQTAWQSFHPSGPAACPLAAVMTHSRPDSDAQPSSDMDVTMGCSTARLDPLCSAASMALTEVQAQHQLEGSLLTASMMAASEAAAAADKGGPRCHSSRSVSFRETDAAEPASDKTDAAQPASFKSLCAHLRAPIQANKAADELYASRKFSHAELTLQDPRSPRRTASHAKYDSRWDDLQVRHSCEKQILESFSSWCDR